MNPHPASRIPPVPRRRLFWYARLVPANQRRRYGQELEPARLWARSPKVFAALSLLYGALDRRRSPIEPALRSLLTVRVSQINWCTFCVDINAATGLKRGVSEAQLAALADFEASQLFDARQKAALAYAEAMTRSDAGVDDALMARVKSHFSDDAVIELTALIAFQNMSSKFNAALAVAPQGFCRVGMTGTRGRPRDARAASGGGRRGTVGLWGRRHWPCGRLHARPQGPCPYAPQERRPSVGHAACSCECQTACKDPAAATTDS